MSDGLVFGICNPLLDISANVGEDMLTKYNLQPGNAILAAPEHLPLYEDLVKNFPVEYIAGGSAQNTIRACQWMLQDAGKTAFAGCVGKDEFADKLRQAATADGVDVHYLVDAEAPTGSCAVLVVGKERSLVANLGAANNYKHDHILTEEMQGVLNRSSICYASGFFLTVSPGTAEYIGKFCAEHNKIFACNLSAPFIIEFFGAALASILPYADFVFGNESEAQKYADVNNLEDKTVKGAATYLSLLPKASSNRPRIVVITQGADPTIVATSGKIVEYPVEPIESSKIVDTNGAGDSFVGGFFSQLKLGKDIAECVRAGNYCAGVVIQRSGCTFPNTPSFQ